MTYYMIWFTGIVIGCFLIAFVSRAVPSHRLNPLDEPMPNVFGFLLPAAAFGIFSGLRNNIGDTFFYIYSYELMDPDTMEPVRFSLNGGIMYNVIQYYCRLRSEDPYMLIIIMSLIACVPIVYIIYKYSCPYELGIALYVLTGYYTLSMNGIRQYAAAGILILGTKYLMSDKRTDFFKYLLFVVGAWLFHSSAIFMIVLYFVVRRRAWSLTTFAFLGGTVFVTLIFNYVLPTFLDLLENTDYAKYAENGWFTNGIEEGSNIIRVFVLLVPLVLAFLQRQYFSERYGRRWDILVNLALLNLAFYILSLYNWIFARLAIYTSIYAVIMMTYVIARGQDRKNTQWLYPSSLALYSVYFYYIQYSIIGYESDLF